MAEERDPNLSAAYRALGAEEPPRALDEAILAASRRPLAKPWTRRWAVPLSLAAVLVLSVTVTLRIQHEQPGIAPPAPASMEAVRETMQQATSSPAVEERPRPKAEPQARPAPRKEPLPFPVAPQDRADVAAASPAPAQALAKRSAPMAASAPAAPGTAGAETPERELERIAALRRDGKHDEADKALAEFRKRYPDFHIPAPMLERVERR